MYSGAAIWNTLPLHTRLGKTITLRVRVLVLITMHIQMEPVIAVQFRKSFDNNAVLH